MAIENDEIVTSITYDARGDGARQVIAQGQQVVKTLTDATKASEVLSQALVKVNEPSRGLSQLLNRLESEVNPLQVAFRKASEESNRLAGAIRKLQESGARSNDQDKQLERMLSLVPAVTAKVSELTTALAKDRDGVSALAAAYKEGYASLNSMSESLGRLIAKFDPATASAKVMANEIRSLNEAQKLGVVIAGGYDNALEKLTRGYNQGSTGLERITAGTRQLTQAQKELAAAAREEVRIRGNQESVNSAFTGGGSGKSAADSAEVFSRRFEDEKRLFDFETRHYELLAKKQQEILTFAKQANKERFEFVEQIAPSSNIEEQRRKVKQAADEVAKEQEKLATSAQKYIAIADPAAEVDRRHALALIELRKHLDETRISQDQYNKLIALPKAELLGMAGAQTHVAGTSRVMQYALTNLSFQINDVVSGLAMGQAPFRIFAQQAGQFVQIFQQAGGVTGVLKDAAAAFGRWAAGVATWVATPVGAAITATVAFAGALAVVAARAISNEAQIRRLNDVIATSGGVSNTTSAGLQKLSYDLRAVGLSAADAEASIGKLGRNQAVNLNNPNSVRTLARLGLDVGARLGVGDVAGIDKVSEAATSGAEAMIKLAQETGVYNEVQARAALLSSAMGNRLKEQEIAIKAMSVALEGTAERQKSGWSKLMDSIGAGWNALVNKMADTNLFSGIDSLFTRMSNNLKYIIENGKLAPGTLAEKLVNGPTMGYQDRLNLGRRQAGLPAITSDLNPTIPSDTLSSTGMSGAALRAASLSSAQIEKLNSEFANRLDAWLNALSEADRNLIRITSGFAESGHKENSNHYRGTAVDVKGISNDAQRLMNQFGLSVGVVHPSHLHVEPSEIPPATAATAAARVAASKAFNEATAMARDSTGTVRAAPTVTSVQGAETERELQLSQERIKLAKLFAIEQAAATAANQSYEASLKSGIEPLEATSRALTAYDEARKVALINLDKESQAEALRTKGLNQAAAGYDNSREAGLRADAMAQARVANLLTGADVQTKYKEILEASAASEVRGAAEQVAAQKPVLTGQQMIAEAAKQGALAERNARIENEATIQVQKALDAARSAGLTVTENEVKALREKIKVQILDRETAANTIQTVKELTQARDTQQQLQLQVGLQGQTTEEINRQVAVLQKKQEIERDAPGLALKEKDARIAAVDATQRQVIALEDARRAQQRLEDAVRGFADTIVSTLGQAITDAFSGTKVESWGVKLKGIISSTLNQIAQFAFIRPAIGTVLGGLGLNSLAQQYGTFSSLFGGGTGTGTTSSTTQASGSGLNTGTILQGGGLLKDLFGFNLSDVFGKGSGIGDFFSGGLGGIFQHTPSVAADFIGPMAPVQGSIFGSTTLGGALGGIGAGFGAGTLLNSLLGGNKITGTAGSGLGSLAGTAIGSLLGGPILGGILGGLGGGVLGGLFGNKKPPNQAAGAGFDLSTGLVTGGFAGGNSKIDQPTQAAAQNLQAIVSALKAIPGNTLGGQLLFQNGINTGTTIDWSGLTGVGGRFSEAGRMSLGKDPAAAVEEIGLALAQSLTGVSATVRTILDNTTDLSKLAENLNFASVYENLEDAADSAFANIDADAKKIGPYRQAIGEIADTFGKISDKATELGLALDPVNAGLVEATRRLNVDFVKSLDQVLNAASDKDFLNVLTSAHQNFVDLMGEAGALGKHLDLSVTDKIGTILHEQTRQVLKDLTDDQLQLVADTFKDIDVNISSFATSLIGATKAVEQTTDSLSKLRDSLMGGPLSGLSLTGQTKAANDNFGRILNLVRGGDKSQYDALAEAGGNLVSLGQQAYGNAPAVETTRRAILGVLDNILSGRSFDVGTTSTPPGLIKVHRDEWISQSGGMSVFPRGSNPLAASEASSNQGVEVLKEILSELKGRNRVAVSVGGAIVNEVRGVKQVLGKQNIYEPRPRRMA